ncbi:indolepyruvate oxidoreductase subunit beta [candidate division KSB1 bacterium]|nr:indolepyruvate oxidoreductase subunit beta [candidate division KSB1 bacterium]
MSRENSITNVVFCGVGGQGIIVASDILSDVALSAGFDVKKSEVHGMAQRGGSVISQVRFGEKVYSPLISKGGADIIVAFEKLEALRYLDYLRPGGSIFINDQEIIPLTVFSGEIEYPKNIAERCRTSGADVFPVQGIQIAEVLGNSRALNVVMLGALSGCLDFSDKQWLEAIRKRIPAKYHELNENAFLAGKKAKEPRHD